MAVDLTPPGGNKISTTQQSQSTSGTQLSSQLQQRLDGIQSTNQTNANLKVNSVVKAVVETVQSLNSNPSQGTQPQGTQTPGIQGQGSNPTSATNINPASPQGAASTATSGLALLQATLNIDGDLLNVVSERALAVGEILVLKVLSKSQLEVLQHLATTNSQLAQTNQGLRNNLPAQQDFTQLLQKLIQVAPKLPAVLANLAKINPQLFTTNTATPERAAQTGTQSAKSQPSPLLQQNAFSILAKSIATLIKAVPPAKTDYTAEGVKQLLQNSGALLENKIAKAVQSNPSERTQQIQNATQGDLKATLNQVRQAIQNTSQHPEARKQFETLLNQLLPQTNAPNNKSVSAYTSSSSASAKENFLQSQAQLPQLLFPLQSSPGSGQNAQRAKDQFDLTLSTLLRQVAASIARIQVHQFSALQSQQMGEADPGLLNTWQFEIPLLNNQQVESFQVRIEEREQEDEKEQAKNKKTRQWTVTLAFDLDPLGPMSAILNVVEDSVSATIWAEKQHTLKVLNKEVNTLRESLTNVGLQVNELECRFGVPQSTATQLTQSLVDIHT